MSKKLAFCALSLLLCSCTTVSKENLKFIEECNTSPNNFLDSSLIEERNNQKTIYISNINTETCSSSFICSYMLTNDNGWDFIEVNLKKNNLNVFPDKTGLYKLYKDYEFKKCIPNLYSKYISTNDRKANRSDEKGSYCIASEEIEKPVSKLKYESKSEEIDIQNSKETIFKSTTTLYLGDKVYGRTTQVFISTPRSVKYCEKNRDKKYYEIIKNI